MRLKDKVVVVTGASAGMGREMTKRFAEEGACVVAVARRREVLEGLQKECEGFAGKVEIYAGDCGSKEVCEGMIQYAVEKFGKLDALVNNAGIMDDMAGVGDFQDEFIDKISEKLQGKKWAKTGKNGQKSLKMRVLFCRRNFRKESVRSF